MENKVKMENAAALSRSPRKSSSSPRSKQKSLKSNSLSSCARIGVKKNFLQRAFGKHWNIGNQNIVDDNNICLNDENDSRQTKVSYKPSSSPNPMSTYTSTSLSNSVTIVNDAYPNQYSIEFDSASTTEQHDIEPICAPVYEPIYNDNDDNNANNTKPSCQTQNENNVRTVPESVEDNPLQNRDRHIGIRSGYSIICTGTNIHSLNVKDNCEDRTMCSDSPINIMPQHQSNLSHDKSNKSCSKTSGRLPLTPRKNLNINTDFSSSPRSTQTSTPRKSSRTTKTGVFGSTTPESTKSPLRSMDNFTIDPNVIGDKLLSVKRQIHYEGKENIPPSPRLSGENGSWSDHNLKPFRSESELPENTSSQSEILKFICGSSPQKLQDLDKGGILPENIFTNPINSGCTYYKHLKIVDPKNPRSSSSSSSSHSLPTTSSSLSPPLSSPSTSTILSLTSSKMNDNVSKISPLFHDVERMQGLKPKSGKLSKLVFTYP